MTREEALYRLDNLRSVAVGREDEAIDIAIEALQAEPNKAVPPSLADVYKWERDIALSQLEEYGIGFAEKKRDDLLEVVRCKDCRWHDNRYGDVCHNPRYGDGWANYPPPYVDEDYWCKDGERKGGDSE